MDVLEAVKSRKSIRYYKPDTVPREVLRQLLEVALRAPSWANTQPWEFAVVTGQPLDEIKHALIQKLASGEPAHADIPYPSFGEPYQQRREESSARKLIEQGISRDDKVKRQQYQEHVIRFADAPCGIIFYIDRSLSLWSLLDIGLLLENIALAAQGYGLGTCIEAVVVRFPDVLRKYVPIPESKRIVMGMAVGYPDFTAPVNKGWSTRLPLDAVSSWHGFGD